MPQNPSKNNFFALVEWQLINKSLMIFGLSVLLSVAIPIGAYFFHQQQAKSHKALNTDLSLLRSAHYEAQETATIINGRYVDAYESFIEKGFFLNDPAVDLDIQRTAIFKKLEQAILNLNLPQAENNTYQFDRQKLLSIPHLEIQSTYAVYVAPLTLNLGALHEGDILNFFESIELQAVDGLLNIQQCNLELISEIDVNNVSEPYLKVICILLWYTSKLKEDV